MKKDVLNSKLSIIKLNAKLQEIKANSRVVIQSLLFPKDSFNLTQAEKWADKNKYKTNHINTTANFIRMRQKDPGKYNLFRTIKLKNGVKALIAVKEKSKFRGRILLKSFSKFSEDIKSDLEIKIPMNTEIWILKDGPNRDGNVRREDLEDSLFEWCNTPIIDFHDKSGEPTIHKLSDRKGYVLDNPRLEFADGHMWIVVPAEITDRSLAYQLYLREKRGKPLEASAEYGWNKYWINGELNQINITPHLISIVDEGHIKGNKLKIAA